MKLALILLGTLGVLILLWSAAGLSYALSPPEDVTPEDITAVWWSVLREAFLGGSLTVMAIVLWRRRAARDRMLGGPHGR